MTSLSPTLELACELIRRPSVTPLDEGCQQLMMQRLEACGFAVERMRIEEVDNFWARMAATARCCALPAIPMWSRPARCRAGSIRRSKC